MKPTFRVSLLFIVMIFTNCKTEQIITKRDFAFIKDENLVEIQKAKVKGSYLLLDVLYRGGCKNDHNFSCIYIPEVNTPGSDTLKLSLIHESEDLCYAIVSKQLSFRRNSDITLKNHSYLKVNGTILKL